MSPRSVSDLERGINRTARKDTARAAGRCAGPGRAGARAVRGGGPRPGPGRARCWRPGEGRRRGRAAAATRTLPRDIASFTGRQARAGAAAGAADGVAADGGVVGIHAIDGMAGIGKTTFAVHAAHRLAAGFPDGQFFLPLHAHTPGQRPVDPADALASLLLTAGVPRRADPAGAGGPGGAVARLRGGQEDPAGAG